MTKEISTFEAKCKNCGGIFAHPSLSDFSYGEAIFYTDDGKYQVMVNAFAEFPQKIASLVTSKKPDAFWHALAALADPVHGKPLTIEIPCPSCCSTELEYWAGNRIDSITLPDISFVKASTLGIAEIKNILSVAGLNA